MWTSPITQSEQVLQKIATWKASQKSQSFAKSMNILPGEGEPLPAALRGPRRRAEPIDDSFWLTDQQQRDTELMHDNCGHSAHADFARMVRLGDGTPEW